MRTARLADLGLHLSSRDRARQLREEVLRSFADGLDRLAVDLGAVRSISDSFADEFFAVLATELGAQRYAASVAILNASVLVNAAIERVVQARLSGRPGSQPREPTFELSDPPEELVFVP